MLKNNNAVGNPMAANKNVTELLLPFDVTSAFDSNGDSCNVVDEE